MAVFYSKINYVITCSPITSEKNFRSLLGISRTLHVPHKHQAELFTGNLFKNDYWGTLVGTVGTSINIIISI